MAERNHVRFKLLCGIAMIIIVTSILFFQLTDTRFCSSYLSENFCSYLNFKELYRKSPRQKNITFSSLEMFTTIKTTTVVKIPELGWLEREDGLKNSNYGDNTCRDNSNRAAFTKIFKTWLEIAKKYNITYFLTTGTLLGAWRNQDLIPYDQDMDVLIDAKDNEKIDKLKTKRNTPRTDTNPYIIIQEDWKLPYAKRRRFKCNGEQVSRYSDGCSFQEPLGRLIDHGHMDIYDYKIENGKVKDPSEWEKEYPTKDIFPLKKCMFMKLETVCPKNPRVVLEAFYGKNLLPKTICKNGHWVKRAETIITTTVKPVIPTTVKSVIKIPELGWLEREDGLKHSNYGDNTCRDNSNRAAFTKIFKTWLEIAKKYNITYFLTTGTLLGAWRNQDLIPYEQDMDVLIDAKDSEKIAKLKTKRNTPRTDTSPYIILQEDWKLPYAKRRRFKCDGGQVSKYSDGCSFQEPLGRLIDHGHMDIYDYKIENGKVKDPSEWKKEYPTKDIFPLKKCMFMKLETVCPKNPRVILEAFYGKKLLPKRICKNGHWVNRAETVLTTTPKSVIKIPELGWLEREDGLKNSNYGDNTCRDNSNRVAFTKIFKRWLEIAKKYNITYFLTTGTLLGAWRNQDLIPYDQDMDVLIDAKDNEKIAKLKTKRNTPRTDSNPYIIIQEDWKLPYAKRRRFKCNGEQVSRYSDQCSFQEPLGRLIDHGHMDIYDYKIENDKVKDPSEWKKEYSTKDIFPLKKCMFMKLETVCPKNPSVVLEAFYGKNLSPKTICKNGTWVKNENM